MTDRAEAAAALAREIEVAFADAAYPGDENLVPPEQARRPEWYEVVKAFRGKSWRGLPVEFLFYHHDALCVFTPEAYRYYLPAYLLVSVLDSEEADIIPEYVIYGLSPSEHTAQHRQLRQLIEGFTASQRQAVRSFLVFMREHDPGGLEDSIDKALENIGS